MIKKVLRRFLCTTIPQSLFFDRLAPLGALCVTNHAFCQVTRQTSFFISLVLQPQESFYCHFFSIKATSVTRVARTVLMKLKAAHAIPQNIMQCTRPNITNQHHALHAIPSRIMQFHVIQFSTCHKWIDEDKTNVSSPASERPATLATVDQQRLEPWSNV